MDGSTYSVKQVQESTPVVDKNASNWHTRLYENAISSANEKILEATRSLNDKRDQLAIYEIHDLEVEIAHLRRWKGRIEDKLKKNRVDISRPREMLIKRLKDEGGYEGVFFAGFILITLVLTALFTLIWLGIGVSACWWFVCPIVGFSFGIFAIRNAPARDADKIQTPPKFDPEGCDSLRCNCRLAG